MVLECPVEGLDLEPGFTLSWERNAGSFPRDRVEFLCDNRTLVLRDADISDVDSYICRVLEPSGRTFRFTTLLTLFSEFAQQRPIGSEVPHTLFRCAHH